VNVRNSIDIILINDPLLREKEPEEKPVCKYLSTAIDAGKKGLFAKLCNALEKFSHTLRWEFGYPSMPAHLYESYAYTEVLGPNGNLYSDKLTLGFVLLAPRCHYPDHRHGGIEESYLCLSGQVIQNKTEKLNPGDFLFNHPGKKHALTVGPDAPCLLAFAWNADPEVLLNYSMEFE